ncbi:hypothetical protein CSOJ01_15143 [Colletotrichum sojae]|uniref:Uncharacterized protein n=1 Tax=Colletotrichum sojae TaxID=2175907 RepID=A0A8H6IN38_9PEZI|nr:hypothetical protein CSOJ01_15143 [Colletotrichum sojae]
MARGRANSGGQVKVALSPSCLYRCLASSPHHRVYWDCIFFLASRLIPARVARWPKGTGSVVPCLASRSASSLPLIPWCPGAQWVCISAILAASWISRKAACEESGASPRIPWITLVLSIQMCIGWPWEVRRARRSPALAP